MKRLFLALFKVIAKVKSNLKKIDLTSENAINFQGFFCLKRFLGTFFDGVYLFAYPLWRHSEAGMEVGFRFPVWRLKGSMDGTPQSSAPPPRRVKSTWHFSEIPPVLLGTFPKDPAILETLRDSELLRRSVFTTRMAISKIIWHDRSSKRKIISIMILALVEEKKRWSPLHKQDVVEIMLRWMGPHLLLCADSGAPILKESKTTQVKSSLQGYSCASFPKKMRWDGQTAYYHRRKPKEDGGKGTAKKTSRQFATNVTTIYNILWQFATFYDNFRLFVPLSHKMS